VLDSDSSKLMVTGEMARESLELANAITVSSALGKEVTLPLKRSLFDTVLKKFIRESKSAKGASDPKKVVLPGLTA
jgi:hypothetical protein